MYARKSSTTADNVIRQIITSSGPRFASVAFVKKDGSLRHMTYVNARHRVKHLTHTARGEQASATFARNNPDMLRVWCTQKNGFRTVTLPRVVSIRVDGKAYRVRSYREAARG